MATLAAHDQENVVRNLQVGPTGKPLNAGVKAFGAKTPGNKAPKTPFKIPLNDENAVNHAGKSGKLGGKSNGNLFMTAKKGGQLDSNAFVTPAGPRARAPLGMKTTNAKSNAFKTPAPLSSNGKTQKASPRLRRPKVKIHQPELEAESEDDVPEIEYMPPKEVPLEDDMDDYLPKDWSLNINPDTMGRDILLSHTNPIEDDGRPRKLREFEEGLARDKKIATEEFENIFEAQMAKDEADARRYFGVEEPKGPPKAAITRVAPKKINTGVSTLKARAAASALQPSSRSNVTLSTTASKPRLPTAALSSKKNIRPLAQPTMSRQATAVAASKSTIGYAQGRAGRTPPIARKPLSNVTKPAPFSAARRPEPMKPSQSRSGSVVSVPAGRARSNFSRSSSTATDATLVTPAHEAGSYRTAEDEERELALMFLSRSDDEDDDDAWMNSFNSQLQGNLLEDELDDFQFQVPDFA